MTRWFPAASSGHASDITAALSGSSSAPLPIRDLDSLRPALASSAPRPEDVGGLAIRRPQDENVGLVSLVGAGPGDPELLTLRAARRIAEADVLVYDHLVGEGIVDLARPRAQRLYVGKEAGNHALPQESINALLVELARQGLRVVRLKGGDPFIFGRGGEEMQELARHGIACEVVPGVTAAAGMASCTGIPLTHRDYAQTVVLTTGHLKDGTVRLDWETLARPRQTVVIYMGLSALEIICRELVAHGLDGATPGAVVHAACTPRQRTVTARVDTLPEAVRQAGLRSPALIVIGPVVALHDELGAVIASAARMRPAASTP